MHFFLEAITETHLNMQYSGRNIVPWISKNSVAEGLALFCNLAFESFPFRAFECLYIWDFWSARHQCYAESVSLSRNQWANHLQRQRTTKEVIANVINRSKRETILYLCICQATNVTRKTLQSGSRNGLTELPPEMLHCPGHAQWLPSATSPSIRISLRLHPAWTERSNNNKKNNSTAVTCLISST